MTKRLRYWTIAFLLTLLAAGDARGDRVVLSNGNVLQGTVIKETESVVVLLLEEGMKMRLDRSRVREIVREARPEPVPEPVPPVEPDPPEPGPEEPVPEPEAPPPEPEPAPQPSSASSPGLAKRLFEVSAGSAWDGAYSRFPVLGGSRTVGFRAYEYVGHEPVARPIQDPALKMALLEHGHGGSLSRWDFVYVGMREFRYGDQVKLVAEITEPAGMDPLIRLKKGPLARARRLQVILVKRNYSVKCYATPTLFTNKDFRRQDLDGLATRALPVRVFRKDLASGRTTWLRPAEGRVLEEIFSRFGGNLRGDLERYQFRARWFATTEHERPAIDPERLRRNDPKPLAAKGTKAAAEAEILAHWGGEEKNRQLLSSLCGLTLRRLGRMGVRPGDSYYVERDAVSEKGQFGVTIRTHRYLVPEHLLSILESGK